MRSIVFCAMCLQLAWGYDYPGSSKGVGAYAFSDSSGRKYGGTYDLKDGQVVSSTGNFPPGNSYTPGNSYNAANSYNFPGSFPGSFPDPFADAYQGYGYGYNPTFEYPGDNFFSTYFANLNRYLQDFIQPRGFSQSLPFFEPLTPFRRFKPFRPFTFNERAFHSNIQNQNLAYSAARKAFDLTSNQIDYIPNFDYRFQPFNDFSGFGDFRNMPNSAFASAGAGPGYNHQFAAINPANPNTPNVNKVNQFSGTPKQGGFYSVSSKSFASSSNVDGKEQSSRGAETVVNDNGKVTKYKVGN